MLYSFDRAWICSSWTAVGSPRFKFCPFFQTTSMKSIYKDDKFLCHKRRRFISILHRICLNYPIQIILSVFLFFITIRYTKHLQYDLDEPLFVIDKVLSLDYMVYRNVKANLKGAYSSIHWDRLSPPYSVLDDLHKFQVVPLMATVDRRPLTARMQIMSDSENLHADGHLLGCALTSSTFVSNLRDISTTPFKRRQQLDAKCDICFQFSSREDMNSFVEGPAGYEPIRDSQTSLATKCFPGKAEVTARFARWQKKDERFVGHGYPFTVDCRLENGIKELTCDGITKMYESSKYSDALQKIYFSTEFQLNGYFTLDYTTPFVVESIWPWEAVQSHNDNRRHIAQSLPSRWDDSTSKYIPSNPQEMKLVHIEGPSYSMGSLEDSVVLKSMMHNKQSPGGVHPRFLVNLIHFIRLAPHSTHMIAVVDGQTQRTYEYLQQLLQMKMTHLYPYFANAMVDNMVEFQTKNYISIGQMLSTRNRSQRHRSDVTLGQVLERRGIHIRVVPIVTPSIAFEKSVCGIQYQLTWYLAARYAADYQVMVYMDGDTSFIEHSGMTMQEILYNRLFSTSYSNQCVGHRFRLLEQYISPELDSVEKILNCTYEVSTNKQKWLDAVNNCQLKEGHIAARSDSIYELNVHHPETRAEFLIPGVRDCISPGGLDSENYFLNANELVQIHLRNRLRKEECACTL